MRKLIWFLPLLLLVALLSGNLTFAQSRVSSFGCEDPYSLCTERQFNRSFEYPGRYIGHDEPSLLFYSDERGSGNYNVYRMVLPTDPQVFPTDANRNGTGGPTVWNFQLHPAFWFGMALCDSESYPLATNKCEPDTDENIFDDPNPKSEEYIGHHPGAAFLELQFYPPGWVNSYTQNQYAAALHINSFNEQALGPKGPIDNNADCQNKVGLEPTIFALLTLDGKSQAPADALNNDPNKQAVLQGETFLMNPGDRLVVTIRDTPDGLRTTVEDLTTGQTGFMTASIANGFAQIIFDPNPTATCSSRPYAYHPMYSTSSEHTRVPWAAHSYNVAFSDEIGHFNYCDVQDGSIIPGLLGACISSPVESEASKGVHNEVDDFFCVDTASSTIFGSLAPLGGCLDSDVDFDGIPYHHAWPGSGPDPYGFSGVPGPVRFTSPKFASKHASKHEKGGDGGDGGDGENSDLKNFDRVAFEADLPAIEDSSVCDVNTGNGCVNPPPGALFYPIYSTTEIGEGCWWQLGGSAIPGTKNDFGGSSATEFSTLLGSVYIDGTLSHPSSILGFENFHRVLSHNPCR